MTAPKRLVIPPEIYDAMVAYCRDGLPNEACGFLGGTGGVVERIYPLTNAAASPVFYKPDDRDLEVSSIFHSHVATRAYPSPTDIREAHYPESVFVIVSLEDREHPYSKGYLIHKQDWRDPAGEVEEVEVVVE